MDVLISIYPKYVQKIIAGEKKVEFRKKIPCQSVDKIFVYSTAPQKKIVGWFLWSGYIEGSLSNVWEQSREVAGITEAEYQYYFLNHSWVYAILIHKFRHLKEYLDPWKYDFFYPPQSYSYLREEGDLYEQLRRLV